MNFDSVKNEIFMNPWLYIIVGSIVLIIILVAIRKHRKKKVKKALTDLEVKYASLKTVPLNFKMNKATALGRINPEIAKTVEIQRPIFEEIQSEFKSLSESLNLSDDLLATRKLKDAQNNNAEAASSLAKIAEKVTAVNSALDEVLKQETEQRNQINISKEEFRNLKFAYNSNSGKYVYSYEAIEQKILEIEKQFSAFEELMYASEFQKAADLKEEIVKKIDYLKQLYDKLPGLLNTARVLVPKTIEELAGTYAQANQKGVYLKHLEINKNVEIINDALRGDLNSLKHADIDQVDVHLVDCLTRLNQLKAQIEKEEASFDALPDITSKAFKEVDSLAEMLASVKKTYKDASERFGFDNLQDKLQSYDELVSGLKNKAASLKKQLSSHNVGATVIILGCKELLQDIEIKAGDLKDTKQQLDHACADENEARTSLLKLHLIMNEMQSKVRKHRLRSISSSYEDDLMSAQGYINDVEDLLNESPLNIELLNKTLKEALDFVYTLYNNVNKILGSASMVEQAIVVANRWRSTYPDVDAELARSELCYRNGEYTKALQLAFNAIDLVYPAQAENIIKNNSRKESV